MQCSRRIGGALAQRELVNFVPANRARQLATNCIIFQIEQDRALRASKVDFLCGDRFYNSTYSTSSLSSTLLLQWWCRCVHVRMHAPEVVVLEERDLVRSVTRDVRTYGQRATKQVEFRLAFPSNLKY